MSEININVAKVNENTGRKFCKMNCPADHLAADQKTSFVKVACKCPRQGKNGCNWYHRQRVSNYQNYTCTPRAQPQVGGEDDYTNGTGNGSETGYGGAAETTAAAAATTAAAAATTAAAAASTAAPAAETTAAATAAPTAAPTVAETTAAATAAPTAAPTAAATTAAPIVTTAAPTTAAAPTTTSSTPAPACPPGSNACPGIDEVNSARGGHNTPAADYDADLTAEAQAWADQLFANGVDPSGSSDLLSS